MTNSEQKPGMSTQKKWLIGFGGCLGVVVIAAIALTVLGGLGVNTLKNASTQSVSSIFGQKFKSEPYIAMGWPVKQKNQQAIVLMVNLDNGTGLFAMDLQPTDSVAKLIQNPNPNNLKLVLDLAAGQSQHNSPFLNKDTIKIKTIQMATLSNGKRLPVITANLASRHQKKVVYSPSVMALISEGNHRAILLSLFAHNDQDVSETDTVFPQAYAELKHELVRIISTSELQDRLIAATPVQEPAKKP